MMNKLYIFLLFTVICSGQSKKVIILDSETRLPVENCFVSFNNSQGAYTDGKGVATIPKTIDKIAIKHLGYEAWKNKVTDTIFLHPEILSLEEITINANNPTKKIVRILPARSLNTLMPHNMGEGTRIAFNEQKGIFIPNENPEQHKMLRKILLRPTGYSTLDLSTGKETDFEQAKYSSFKVNLWTVMPDVGVPLKPLLAEDIVVRLEKGNTYTEIGLPEEILLPKEGVFIVISSFTEEYYKKENSVVATAPAFYRIGINKKSAFKMYVRTVDEDGYGLWKRDSWYWKNNSVYLAGFEAEIIP